MKNIKNTFDLSLDIPLYGDINKLNFCNEYELNHYCFYDGDDGGGDLGAEDEAAAESFEAEDFAEFEADQAAQLGDPIFDPGTDFKVGYYNDDGTPALPSLINLTPPGDEFGFHGTPAYGWGYDPDDMTAMEKLGHDMGTPGQGSYLAQIARGFEKDDPGSTYPGFTLGGLYTGFGRGSAADIAQAPPPGSWNPGAAITGLIGPVIGGIPGMIASFLSNLEPVKGAEVLGGATNVLGLPSLGNFISYLGIENPAETYRVPLEERSGYHTNLYKEGGLISLANGGVPEEPRVTYTRQNIDTSAGRPPVNWYNSLDQNTRDYFNRKKNWNSWAKEYAADALGMEHDVIMEGGLHSLDPFPHGRAALEGEEGSDYFTGLPYNRYAAEPIRRFNVIDQILGSGDHPRRYNPYQGQNDIQTGSRGAYHNWLRDEDRWKGLLSNSSKYSDFKDFPINAEGGGGIRDLVNDQTTLLDVINTGQAIPPNLGATQMQGAIKPMQPNQQNAYTQSTQPQSFYAQPQQVKNYGKLY